MLLLVACGGTQPLPDIDATVEVRVVEERITESFVEGKTKAVSESTVQVSSTSEEGGLDLRVDCSLDTEQLRISCEAIGFKTGSQLTWTSTASWA